MSQVFADAGGAARPALIDEAGRVVIRPAAEVDTQGALIYPDIWGVAYGYALGQISTMTTTDGADTWIKTFGYSDGVLVSETGWVRQ